MRGNKRVVGVGLVVILAVVLVILLPPVNLRLRAAAVTLNLLVVEGEWRPLMWLTRDPEVKDYAIETDNELTVRVYTPGSGKANAAIVIYTPFIGGGLDDSRLVNLAESFSRSGFVVAVPWREKPAQLVSVSDQEDIVTSVELLNEKLLVDKVGLFGISYGTGPVFAAAADTRLSDKVDFIVSLNGYGELTSVIDFIASGQSHSYPREILEANLLTRGETFEAYRVSADFEELNEALSPVAQLDDISSELFVIHSTADTYIPFQESVRLHQAANRQLDSSLVLTDVIEHGTYRAVTSENLGRYYLPAFRDFVSVMTEVLRTTVL